VTNLKEELNNYNKETDKEYDSQTLAYLGNSLGGDSIISEYNFDLTALDSTVSKLVGYENVPGKMLLDKRVSRKRIMNKRIMSRAECIMRAGCEKSLYKDLNNNIIKELKKKAGLK